MALYHVQDTVRTLPGGAGESGATVTFKLVADGSTLTTATTDANGFFQKSLAATATSGASSYILHPGPFYWETTIGSYTRRHSSVSGGKTAATDLMALPLLNSAIGTGVISSPGQSLTTFAVTADGADRTVDVATGAAVVQGIAFWNDAIRAVNISANASGNPRIDTVVLEVIPAGNATEGKVMLKVVEGTPAGSPVAPTLTQTSATWQFPLANVAVANGAATLSNANITDRRDYVERSTTTVEADLVLLEARVDDLEADAVAVPRVDLVAYYQAAWDPGSIAANGAITSLFGVTFVGGYSSLLESDVFLASHHEVDDDHRLTLVLCKSAASSDDVFLQVHNHSASSLNPTSATLTILCYRLVLA